MTLHNELDAVLAERAGRLDSWLVGLRRDIHAHPELGFEEVRTARLVAEELGRLGLEVRTGVGGTGVIGTLRGAGSGPNLAIRADLDALPILEQTGLPFASTVPGRMHACGHDIHTSTLLGVAALLKDFASDMAGTVTFLFQPAEETMRGALAMIDDGALDGVDMALGFHNHPTMPAGEFGWCPGAAMAATDRFEITVDGRSGHAALPHEAVDPVIAACTLVTQLQTVVSREVRPIHPAVVTAASIHGGTAFNIIPDRVAIAGTVRTLHASARDTVEQALGRLCDGIATGLRVRCALEYIRGVPALVNDRAVLDQAVEAMRRQFGEEHVNENEPELIGEDFAFMLEKVPGCQIKIGSGAPGRADGLHNSDYNPDERSIGLGAQALSRAALALLG